MIGHRQAGRFPGEREILRQREGRDPDLDAGPAIVAVAQRQHDRRLPVAAVAIGVTEIGAGAVRDLVVETGVRPIRRGVRRRQGQPARGGKRLAEEIEASLDRRGREAVQIGPAIVEQDVGRIVGKRHIRAQSGRGVIHHRLVGPAEALGERHVQPLRALLEQQGAARLIHRPQIWHPAVGGQQLPGRRRCDRDRGRNAVAQAVSFGARGVFDRTFEARQRPDIDHPVIGSCGQRRAESQCNGEGQKHFACRDQHPARRSKHLISPVLPTAAVGHAAAMAAALTARLQEFSRAAAAFGSTNHAPPSGPARDPAGIDVENLARRADFGEGRGVGAGHPDLRPEFCQFTEQGRAPAGIEMRHHLVEQQQRA